MTTPYVCYLLKSVANPNYTYTGVTNNISRRLKQHNGELSGGAKATRKYSDWEVVKTVQLANKSEALSFEYWVKHKVNKNGKVVRSASGLTNKIKRMDLLTDLYT